MRINALRISGVGRRSGRSLRVSLCAVALFAFLAAPIGSHGAIRNYRFEAELDTQTGLLAIRDLKANVVYRQCEVPDISVSNLRESEYSMSFTLNGRWDVTVAVNDFFVDLTVSGDADADFETLDYPGGLVLEGVGEQSLLLPCGAGVMIPFSQSQSPYFSLIPGRSYQTMVDQWGLSMPWIGVTTDGPGSFMLAMDPADAEFQLDATDDGYSYRLQWLASKGKFAYPRRVRYYFAETGGYVRLCKMYREKMGQDKLLITLREKKQLNPDVDKLVGALSLWIDERPDITMFNEMKKAGIDELLVSYHVPFQKLTDKELFIPGRNIPNEIVTPDFARQLQKLGYLVGRYHEFRTIVPYTPGKAAGDRLWTDFDIVHRVGWPEQSAIDKDGNIIQGFQRGGHRCSPKQLEYGWVYMPADQDRMGYNARLLDTSLAVPLFECYSPEHPVTRAEDVRYRYDLHKFACDLGNIVGSENMTYWAVPVVHYAEGPATMVRFHTGVAGTPPGTNPVRITDDYWQTTLNEAIRAPLWQLVFHDAVIITNRWNCTPNYFSDPKAWEKENLISILHGQMPTYFLNLETWREGREGIVRSFKDVCEWNDKTGYDELTDHRSLTPDKKVQQSVFEGGRSVIVNFGDEPWTAPDGTIVPAWGYKTKG